MSNPSDMVSADNDIGKKMTKEMNNNELLERITKNVKTIKNWVTFWSILTLIGTAIILIGLAAEWF